MSAPELVREWFRYAQNDLISARHLYEDLYPKQIEVSCYLSQQCAEKALKGYLFFNGTEPPRTHNLIELCELCMHYNSTFADIATLCAGLTLYGVVVRYPNELNVEETVAQLNINRAQQIYDFCASLMPYKV
jgi:HEPN domain-containing protein